MMHCFDVDIAVKYGILESLLLSHIRYWVVKNKSNGRNFRDGRTWTYNSTKAFTIMFPYASDGQIRRALKKLEDSGLILTGRFNDRPFDRTIWYTLTDFAETIFQNQRIDISKLEEAFYKNENSTSAKCEYRHVQNEEPIPNINTYIEPDLKPYNVYGGNGEIEKEPPITIQSQKDDLVNRFKDPRLVEAIQDWLTYKKERKQSYKPIGLKSLLTQIENYTNQCGVNAVVDIIQKSMASGYQGILWDRIQQPGNGYNQSSGNIFMDMLAEEAYYK